MCAHVWEMVLALGGAPGNLVVMWVLALGGAPGNVVRMGVFVYSVCGCGFSHLVVRQVTCVSVCVCVSCFQWVCLVFSGCVWYSVGVFGVQCVCVCLVFRVRVSGIQCGCVWYSVGVSGIQWVCVVFSVEWCMGIAH